MKSIKNWVQQTKNTYIQPRLHDHPAIWIVLPIVAAFIPFFRISLWLEPRMIVMRNRLAPCGKAILAVQDRMFPSPEEKMLATIMIFWAIFYLGALVAW